MLLRLWRRVRPLIPHVSLVLCGLFLVLCVVDRLNNNMNFIDNDLSKTLLMVLCVVSLIADILLVRMNRRRHK